jgi:hypothetical protein
MTFCGEFRFYHRPSALVVFYLLGVVHIVICIGVVFRVLQKGDKVEVWAQSFNWSFSLFCF